ncbi:DUF695 domain-containing protein [Dermacoccaceae bacterium W4C1]
MGIFGRGKKSPSERMARQNAAIEEFWQWWNTTGARQWGEHVGTSIPDDAVEDIGRRVAAIDDGLAWEFGAGSQAAHLLVVSPEGNPELRAVAARWLAAAPPTDFVWSYADARQPVTDLGMDVQIGGVTVDFSQALVGVNRTGTRVDVNLYHPTFAELDDNGRTMAMFLMLDATLGEKGTESWIGELTPSQAPPMDGFGLSGLRAVVRDLAADFTTEQGEPAWVSLQGSGPAGPVQALVQVPLAAAQFPLLSQHVLVQAAYGDQDSDGFPTAAGEQQLDALREALEGVAGSSGRLVAVETSAGFRRFHLYADAASQAADAISSAADAWDGNAQTVTDEDPGWAEVQHLRG